MQAFLFACIFYYKLIIKSPIKVIPNRLRGAVGLKRKAEFRAALAVFRRKMEAGADKAESQFAEGKHTFLKKVDENFSAIYYL